MNSLLKPLISLQKASKECGTSSLCSSQHPNDLNELLNFLHKINCKDVGINVSHLDSYFKDNTLTCIKIPNTTNIMIDLFCVPKGMHLNFHDHPNTVVITKVLHGNINQRSLDLVDKSFQNTEQSPVIEEEKFTNNPIELEAILYADKNLGPNEMTFLTPDRGNIHSFTANDNTIFLDISIPINDEISFSNYYQEIRTIPPLQHESVDQNQSEAQQESHISESPENIPPRRVLLKPIWPVDMKIWMRRYEGEPVSNYA